MHRHPLVPQRPLAHRLLAYSIIGCILLVIYQFVFMARTSANRDWNHLHLNGMPPVLAKRLLLQHANHSIDIPFKHRNATATAVLAATLNGTPLALSAYNGVFALEQAHTGNYTLPAHDVYVLKHAAADDLAAEIRAAADSGRRAVLLRAASGWVPNHGRTEFPIPVLVVHDDDDGGGSNSNSNSKLDAVSMSGGDGTLEISVGPSTQTAREWRLAGHLPETVVVGDSGMDASVTRSFEAVARAYRWLNLNHGWKPLRSVVFVSYAHFGAAAHAARESGAVAYVSAGVSPHASTGGAATASPALQRSLQAAIAELAAASAEPIKIHVSDLQLALGESAWLLNSFVPSVGVNLLNERATTQVLTLMLATLTQDPILPFDAGSFSRRTESAGILLREAVENCWLQFTTERPWYQWTAKVRALAARKNINLKLRELERCCALGRPNARRNALFALDPRWDAVERLEAPGDVVRCIIDLCSVSV